MYEISKKTLINEAPFFGYVFLLKHIYYGFKEICITRCHFLSISRYLLDII